MELYQVLSCSRHSDLRSNFPPRFDDHAVELFKQKSYGDLSGQWRLQNKVASNPGNPQANEETCRLNANVNAQIGNLFPHIEMSRNPIHVNL
jgi:hypothetical protein